MTLNPRASAFAVHLLTASGCALALLAMMAAVRSQWTVMFAILGVALAVDAVDGPLARRLRVAEVLPRWSGEVLDLVVDFLTYVFIPAYAIAASGLLPEAMAIPLGVVIVTTGALYFADRNMKTSDNYFRGFPGVWNVVALYLFILKPGPWIAAAVILALAALTFAPVKFVHPFRVVRLRELTLAALIAWSALVVTSLVQNLDPSAWVSGALVAIAGYFVLIGVTAADPTDA